MRTRHEYRQALARAVQNAQSESDLSSKIANVILGEIDVLLMRAWSDLSDMGVMDSQMKRARAAVKKRI